MNTTGSSPSNNRGSLVDRPNSPTNNNNSYLNNTTTSSSPVTMPNSSSNNMNSPTNKPANLNLSNNNSKKVTISSPNTTNKTAQHSQVGFVHNPSESGKSGGSFSQSKITVRTCCGVVELTSMKLACLLGMLVTVVGLLVLAAVAISSFVIVSSKATDILIAVGKVTSYFEVSNSLVLKSAYTGFKDTDTATKVASEYKNYTQELKTTLQTILKNLDDTAVSEMFNSTAIESSNYLDSQNSQLLLMVSFGQKDDAVIRINSDTYNKIKETFKTGLDQLVSFVQNKEKEKDTQVLAVTLVQLIVIAVSLFVILPIIVFVFTYAINRDSLYLEKIRRANAIMLMDTMEDDGLRALFRIHCEKEKSIENFLLLEKIQYYRSLCERSLDLQMRLFGDNNVLSDVSSDISGDSAHSAKKKKDSPLEREYAEVEAKKYEVAFEIFTEFLEVTGDMAVNISHVLTDSVKDKLDRFNDKQIETLPEDMFNILEKETCLVMMDTHHRFKQSLAFQREMKIDKIKVDKLKKKKGVDF